MKPKPFTPEELEQLAKLEAMADDDIDTIDIPEIPRERWALVRRGNGPIMTGPAGRQGARAAKRRA